MIDEYKELDLDSMLCDGMQVTANSLQDFGAWGRRVRNYIHVHHSTTNHHDRPGPPTSVLVFRLRFFFLFFFFFFLAHSLKFLLCLFLKKIVMPQLITIRKATTTRSYPPPTFDSEAETHDGEAKNEGEPSSLPPAPIHVPAHRDFREKYFQGFKKPPPSPNAPDASLFWVDDA